MQQSILSTTRDNSSNTHTHTSIYLYTFIYRILTTEWINHQPPPLHGWYARRKQDIFSLILTTIYSINIGMSFGLERCSRMVTKRGKVGRAEGIEPPHYNYLGIPWANGNYKGDFRQQPDTCRESDMYWGVSWIVGIRSGKLAPTPCPWSSTLLW